MAKAETKERGREKVSKEIQKYLSRHHGQGEAYDFNIKMRIVNVPDEVRERLTANQIDNIYNYEAGERLEFFMEELMSEFPWISAARQEGRSGGWLTVVPEDAVFDDYGNIQDLRHAKARLRALDEVDERVKEAKEAFKKDLESKEWWKQR